MAPHNYGSGFRNNGSYNPFRGNRGPFVNEGNRNAGPNGNYRDQYESTSEDDNRGNGRGQPWDRNGGRGRNGGRQNQNGRRQNQNGGTPANNHNERQMPPPAEVEAIRHRHDHYIYLPDATTPFQVAVSMNGNIDVKMLDVDDVTRLESHNAALSSQIRYFLDLMATESDGAREFIARWINYVHTYYPDSELAKALH
ncbi:hypothetical protein F5Y13DRAFT_187255 [Hypoxylon sp. FL1857]|nr:hypothetical protein F5Y13DRAFT_187255 [Hypoxylon sp. FL1857]